MVTVIVELPAFVLSETVAEMVVELVTVNVAEVPPTVTAVAPVNPVPEMLKVEPAPTEVGVNDVIVGGGITVKLVLEVPDPAGVTTVIVPVVAPVGTVNVRDVAETTENVAAETPFKVTEVAPVNPVPLKLTVEPIIPELGEKLEITGGIITAKLAELDAVSPDLVTEIGPVVAVGGTTAVSDEADSMV